MFLFICNSDHTVLIIIVLFSNRYQKIIPSNFSKTVLVLSLIHSSRKMLKSFYLMQKNKTKQNSETRPWSKSINNLREA